ncbi:MAG: dephospho-CoA kinase [Rhodobacteraceae bacterium]|nr:dephospho-CoA kinase [Paracoccaceae bacterium]
MTFIIGLTGSMGMGKSTTADMFRSIGVPVWDADAVVHRLYASGGLAVDAIAKLRPQAILDGSVDRRALKEWIAGDASALRRIEKVVHPLLAEDRRAFLAGLDTDIAVLDFPLLFETGAEKLVDLTLVVSSPRNIQKERILARGTMNEAVLDTILAAQMSDDDKRARADVVIETLSLEGARQAVHTLLEDIRKGRFDA